MPKNPMTPILLLLVCHLPLTSLNLHAITRFQRNSCSYINLHKHFPSKALFKMYRLLALNLPPLLSLQILVLLTRWCLFFGRWIPYKKLPLNLLWTNFNYHKNDKEEHVINQQTAKKPPCMALVIKQLRASITIVNK